MHTMSYRYHIDESTIITTCVFDEDSNANSCKLDIKETMDY